MATTYSSQQALVPEPVTRNSTTLQQFLFPQSSDTPELYIQPPMRCHCEEGRLVGKPLADISFNSFFNSFYECYWVEYTPIRSVQLVLEGRGKLQCSIFRQRPNTAAETICRRFVDLDHSGRAAIAIQLPEVDSGSAGRLYIELGTRGSTFLLDRIAWETCSAALRDVSLGVVICTYDREALLVRNLEALLETESAGCVKKVVVVNHGRPLCSRQFQNLQARYSSRRLQLINQANHGGAGGFTRGAMELLEAGSCSHVLFLDDDIELEPHHLATAVSFVAYTESPVIAGGQMLDLYNRASLFDSGARVENSRICPNHRGLDLTNIESLEELGCVKVSDFNGWWFAIFPVECFRKHGLPLPFFLHVDDVEYGVRLTEAGIRTVVIPPVSIWHEPFEVKPPSWCNYYDVRNWLIFASLYPHRFEFESPRVLLRRLLGLLIRYDYQQTCCINLGIQDFLQGPQLMQEGAPKTHRRIRSVFDKHAAEQLSSLPGVPLASQNFPASPNKVRLRLLSSWLRILIGFPKANENGSECIVRPDMPLEFMLLGRSYVLANGESYFLRFGYSRRKTWSQLFRTLSTVARYAVCRRKAEALWRDAQGELTDHEAWRARFDTAAVR